MLVDFYIENGGIFPDSNYLKNQIGHKIELLYEKAQAIIAQRSIEFRLSTDLSDPIHQTILNILHNFAQGDRYSNINLLVGSSRSNDPIARWFEEVDLPLFEARVTRRKKDAIAERAATIAQLVGPYSSVLHISEMGAEITDLEEASTRSGLYEAVAPHRQLCVLQIIRYWVELLSELERIARSESQDIPFFTEVFAGFYNRDSYLRTRKTWDRL